MNAPADRMIALFTDFGWQGPYVGQLHAVLHQQAPGLPVVDLMHDAPAFDIQASAYLLAALVEPFPAGTVFVGVVDPGVGTDRRGAVVEADGRWFVGPDNGLFQALAQRAEALRWWDITYRPERLSDSFHGRDLFAPVAARVVTDREVPGNSVDPADRLLAGWPAELEQVIYEDQFGNAMTGIRGGTMPKTSRLQVRDQALHYRRTFGEAEPGEAFWYVNSSGLVEIAVNQGSAVRQLALALGQEVSRSKDSSRSGTPAG